MTTHQSDSAVQRDAERAIVDALATELGVVLVRGGTLSLSGGVRIQLDARSEDESSPLRRTLARERSRAGS